MQWIAKDFWCLVRTGSSLIRKSKCHCFLGLKDFCVVHTFIYDVYVKVDKSRPNIRGGSRFSGKVVHMYKGVGFAMMKNVGREGVVQANPLNPLWIVYCIIVKYDFMLNISFNLVS